MIEKYGAGDGIRTRDINLGKVALYQLSYSRPAYPVFSLHSRPPVKCLAATKLRPFVPEAHGLFTGLSHNVFMGCTPLNKKEKFLSIGGDPFERFVC
jgi:hypothetical protein